ncbi:MAG TPA: DUF4382 domain-containing protein [Nitrospirota bacterium]|nr:DUF4382 domain-containing protein [Nitrospirota bacterium]
MSLAITDAPGDFDHVWITVKDVWIHTSTAAGPDDSAWVKNPLPNPTPVDLIALTNGNMQSLWSGVTLTTGTYQQIRLFLVRTYAANPPTGHDYFNEVVIGGTTYPLRIPDAEHGIRLIGKFEVTAGAPLQLAIDFNAGEDIVEFNGSEYVLKPRLAYFDLDHIGAIVGQISTGSTYTTAPHFVIKAEQLYSDGTYTYNVVRRITAPDANGKFTLYPVSVVTGTTNTYDILIRGLGYETMIVKGVPVNIDTTPTLNPTSLPTITMTPGTDYAASGSIISPYGAWVDFYQTLPITGDSPYDVRFRHFNPMTGKFSGFMLSNSPLQWGVYSSGTITFTTVDPEEGVGGYQAVAFAHGDLYDHTPFPGASNPNMTYSSPTVSFGTLPVLAPWHGNTISGLISMSNPTSMNNIMDTGVIFAVYGGMIVDTISTGRSDRPLSPANVRTGGSFTILDIPGGTTADPMPSAYYGVDASFWSSTTSTTRSIPTPQTVDLRSGNDTANLQMLPLY